MEQYDPFLRYTILYILNYFLTLKVVTLWWVLAHEVEYSFEYFFWIVYYLVRKLGQLKTVFHSVKKSEQAENPARFPFIHAQYMHNCVISENWAVKTGWEKKLKIFNFLAIFFAENLRTNQTLR